MRDFRDKTVIVTGASAGVGAATARLFAAEGARVVLAARSAEPLRALAGELGDRAIAVPTDVADPAACAALIDTALDATGRIDVLVNNAGCNHRGAVADLDVEHIERILDINLKAPLRLSRLALPHLMRQGGAIVNVASLAGRVPVDHEASYSASKFGLRAFSRALGEELAGTGVTVSAVSPGPIDTGFIMDHLDQVPDLVFSQPMSTAEEVARQVLACAADGRRERAMPALSGILTNLVYLFPALGRLARPLLEAKGRRVKARYRDRG
ncbi:short-chain dehydrogenase/reductase SDR [Salinisphaera sp. PC39]|uniref:SDR family NAD(P)-dependent oxidoreductase n=1 Tax=Salinisphaera sp. PC39 TaxID=1304156 RepID=UPI00333F2C0F